ncbi:WAP four-disulfide core domain protein 1-like isoform X2 [Acipenser ruthenus]|uniref:WAP four-disulfide core domain protein 1-like isoform X2 n=1 Tax=Acipenser ruthenus TaxID=7906 RepID=UPI00274263A4|nr:WAP four-disulfide core domain protein 1-like isoform X2 [Acipenser ruthenus]
MQSSLSKKLLAAGLCILVLWSGTGNTQKLQKMSLHQKPADKYDDYEYPNQPQSVQYQKNDRCPPPPQMLLERACEVPSCRSDSECERHKRCCYNGCIYACLESVQPPPAEACSTTEDGDEPLHCPTGYECHIINPGNPAAGIPNRGQCIKQHGNSG